MHPGRYTHEVWQFMRYRGGRRASIQACNKPGNNRCTGNNSVLLKLNNSDASYIFWHRKRPTEAWSDNGCRAFLLQLKLLQSCAAETEGGKENLNSSNADSWHCSENGCKWHKINRLCPAKFLLNWCHSDLLSRHCNSRNSASPRFFAVSIRQCNSSVSLRAATIFPEILTR